MYLIESSITTELKSYKMIGTIYFCKIVTARKQMYPGLLVECKCIQCKAKKER